MLEVDRSLLHQVLVHLLAVLPSPLQPGGHRPLIQQEGVNNGLHGQPQLSRFSTTSTSPVGLCRRKNGVPVVAANVRPHTLQR